MSLNKETKNIFLFGVLLEIHLILNGEELLMENAFLLILYQKKKKLLIIISLNSSGKCLYKKMEQSKFSFCFQNSSNQNLPCF